ncbi:hypothetical protein V8E51_019926 [Hyaloscypha variabilis]
MDIHYCFHVHENKQTCRIEIPFDSLYGSQVPSDRHGKRIRGSRPFEKLDITIVHLGFNDSIVVPLCSHFSPLSHSHPPQISTSCGDNAQRRTAPGSI